MRFPKIAITDPPYGFAAVIVAIAVAWGGNLHAAERGAWVTGPALRQKLAEPANLLWSDIALRQALNGLSQNYRVAILLDRRVDPGQKLSLARKGDSLGATLQTIADDCGLGVVLFGNIVYLGPEAAAERLHGLAALLDRDVRRLPTTMKFKYHKLQKLAWEDLASPRDLLTRLAEENGLEISGLDSVPHDLWAAADLPALSLADRLTLIAAEFDLAVRLTEDGKRIQLSPVPANLPRTPDDRRRLATAASPSKHLKNKPTNLETTGIGRLVVERKPLDAVLQELAGRFDLELKIDREAVDAAGIVLDQHVSVHEENTTIDKVLGKLLEQAKLTFRRHGRVVEIFPAT
jgi:hypothetical protein